MSNQKQSLNGLRIKGFIRIFGRSHLFFDDAIYVQIGLLVSGIDEFIFLAFFGIFVLSN